MQWCKSLTMWLLLLLLYTYLFISIFPLFICWLCVANLGSFILTQTHSKRIICIFVAFKHVDCNSYLIRQQIFLIFWTYNFYSNAPLTLYGTLSPLTFDILCSQQKWASCHLCSQCACMAFLPVCVLWAHDDRMQDYKTLLHSTTSGPEIYNVTFTMAKWFSSTYLFILSKTRTAKL